MHSRDYVPAATDPRLSTSRSSAGYDLGRTSTTVDRHQNPRDYLEDGSRRSHRDRDREYDRNDRDKDRLRDRDRERESSRDYSSSRGKDRDHDRGRERDRDRDRDRERERERERGGAKGRDHDRDRHCFDRDRHDRDRRRSRSREDYRRKEYSHSSQRDYDYYGRKQGRDKSPIALFDKYSTENLSPFRGVTLPLEERQRVLKNWDAAPPGFERISADKAKLTGLFPPPGNIAKITNFVPPTLDPTKAAMLAMLTNASSGEGASYLSSGAAIFAPALSKQARRVYVGNIPTTCTEEEIADHFNERMEAILPPTTGHYVLGVEIAGDRDYAFVDLRSPEEAQLATAVDGTSFKGHTITVRRTREYENATSAVPEKQAPPSEENQLVIAGIPKFLSEPHLKYLLTPFGQVKFMRILYQSSLENSAKDAKESLGIAVLELDDPTLVDLMCEVLNGFQLGEEYSLKVRRLPDCVNDDEVALALSLFSLTPGKATDDPSPILQLLNMVVAEDLTDDQDYGEIVDDIREECSEFGTVANVLIPRPSKEGGRVAGVGKVFVEFSKVAESMEAAAKLAGRTFADRTVLVSYYPPEKYHRRIL